MDVEQVKERITLYKRKPGLQALRLSPSELKQLRMNVTTGTWLDMQRASFTLDDPEVVAVLGGICIQCDPEGRQRMDNEEAVATIAAALTQR